MAAASLVDVAPAAHDPLRSRTQITHRANINRVVPPVQPESLRRPALVPDNAEPPSNASLASGRRNVSIASATNAIRIHQPYERGTAQTMHPATAA
jgi:hypothetical protein